MNEYNAGLFNKLEKWLIKNVLENTTIKFALFARVACHKFKKVHIWCLRVPILKIKCKNRPIWYLLLTWSFFNLGFFSPLTFDTYKIQTMALPYLESVVSN